MFCTDGCSDISINYVNKVMKKMESLDGVILFLFEDVIINPYMNLYYRDMYKEINNEAKRKLEELKQLLDEE